MCEAAGGKLGLCVGGIAAGHVALISGHNDSGHWKDSVFMWMCVCVCVRKRDSQCHDKPPHPPNPPSGSDKTDHLLLLC